MGPIGPNVGVQNPTDQGFIAWSIDPSQATATVTPTSGSLYLVGLRVRTSVTTTTAWISQAAAGTLLTAGRNFLGLYNSSGTLVATSNDLSAAWAVANTLTAAAWTVPAALTPGLYWLAILANSTGLTPAFRLGMNAVSTSFSSLANANLVAAADRMALNGTGLSTLPSTIAPASNAGTVALLYWGGIS